VGRFIPKIPYLTILVMEAHISKATKVKFGASHSVDLRCFDQFINVMNLPSCRAAAAFLPKFCSQPGSDLDFWDPQVW